MYFGYGWPRVAFAELPPGSDDAYIYLHLTDKYVFAVSRKSVQLWSGGIHRIRLSECTRSEDDIKQEGCNVAAVWSSAKATLAILTSDNYLHLYAIHAWKDTLLPHSSFVAKDIQKVDIYLRSSIKMDSESRALSITGDSRLLLVGFADGTVATLSWLGKVREAAFPLDEATSDYAASTPGALPAVDSHLSLNHADTPHSGASGPAAARLPNASSSHQTILSAVNSHQLQPPPLAPPNGTAHAFGGPAATAAEALVAAMGSRASSDAAAVLGRGAASASTAIMQIGYCEKSKQVVLVLGDGSCAVCATSDGGLQPLSELCFGRWLCGPDRRVVCARVGARAQLIALGRDNGEVDLHRLHRSAVGSPGPYDDAHDLPPDVAVAEAPVRTLSLESWGHKLQQTGRVVQVEWSPDCRALAVGYAFQGVVVWSPSGCRLMCSLRQPGLSTFPSLTKPPPTLQHTSSFSPAVAPTSGLVPRDSETPPAPHRTVSNPGGLAGADSCNNRAVAAAAAALRLPSAGTAPAAPSGAASATGPLGAGGSGVPLDGGVTALAWGPMGYQLLIAETGGSNGLAELQFAHSIPNHHRVAHSGLQGGSTGDEVHVLQAHDRLLLIREAGEASLFGAPWASGDGLEPAGNQVGDLTVAHVTLPYNYISANWPVSRAAVSASGGDIAVAGRHGLALYNRASERWRLFGDVSQERSVCCRALGWLGNGVVVACSGPDPDGRQGSQAMGSVSGGGAASAPLSSASSASGQHELLLFPRYHLDLTSLLVRYPLAQPPIAMDCLGSHILLAAEPLEMTLLEVVIDGELSPTSRPRAILTAVRQVSLLDVGRPLADVALVPMVALGPISSASGSGEDTPVSAASLAPRQVVLLRWGGLLSVLDLERGSEVATSTEVEAFWLSDPLTCNAADPTAGFMLQQQHHHAELMAGLEASPSVLVSRTTAEVLAGALSLGDPIAGAAAQTLDVEMPWWLYGPAGMQLLFPSSLAIAPRSPMADACSSYHDHQDIELEFDQEVYPVGISLADDAIIGVTQRIVRGPGGAGGLGYMAAGPSASLLPCFHPIPESQPVLPCLLRRLLLRGAFPEAVSLARRHARGPHFARSLEWLLFTALESETSTGAVRTQLKRGGTLAATGVVRAGGLSDSGIYRPYSLLVLAAELVRQFPQLFAEVVVSVARKTDSTLWPPLFDAVGSPSELLEGLLAAGELASAACFLLVIDRLEGAASVQVQALRLLRNSLARGMYPLCGELLRFVVPPPEPMDEARFSGGGAAPAPSSGGAPSIGKGDADPTATREAFAADQGLGAEASSVSASAFAAAAAIPPPEAEAGGRSWFGWLLGYGPNDAAASTSGGPGDTTSAGGAAADGSGAVASSGSASAKRHVVGTLALLDQQGTAAASDGDGRDTSTGGSPGAATREGRVSPSPSLAHLVGAGSGPLPAGISAATSACFMVADHAWGLLELGHLNALGQLAAASSFMPMGLEGLMNQHRDGNAYAAAGCAAHSAHQLLGAVAVAVSEFPVWSSEDVEARASVVAALVRAVGAITWGVALGVLLVDVGVVAPFREQHAVEWEQFVDLLRADASFSFLYDIVQVLSKEGSGGGARAGKAAAAAGAAAAAYGAAVSSPDTAVLLSPVPASDDGEAPAWSLAAADGPDAEDDAGAMPAGGAGAAAAAAAAPGGGEIMVGSPRDS